MCRSTPCRMSRYGVGRDVDERLRLRDRIQDEVAIRRLCGVFIVMSNYCNRPRVPQECNGCHDMERGGASKQDKSGESVW